MTIKNLVLEAQETAETLIEDRGETNAREWVQHCMVRDTSGFWKRVMIALDNINSSHEECGGSRHEDSASYRSAMIDAGRGHLIK